MTPQPAVTRQPTGAATPLRYRDFRNIWAASIVSNLGSLLQTVAATWLMLEMTGSAFWVGLMVAAPTLPLLLVAMPAGAMADLIDRRRVVLASQTAMAVIATLTAGMYYAGVLTPALLLGLGLVLGTAMAVNMPSWQAMTPDLVPNHHVANAVALNSAAFNVARAVGPALGGLIVAVAGPGPAFLANAASYVALLAVVYRLPRRNYHDETESMSAAIASGLRYASLTPPYRWVLFVAASFAITAAVVQATLPTFTADILGGGAGVYGVLLGMMGIGALGGAFTRPAVAERLGRRMVPGSIGAFGIAGVALGLSRHPVVAGAALVVIGFLWVWILSTLNATAQLLSPAWVRGRMMSLYTLAFMGVLPLGSVLAGSVADVFGPDTAVVVLSVMTALLGVVVSRLPLPLLQHVVTPTLPEGYQRPPHASVVEGGPVMVLTTFVIADEALHGFLDIMEQLRRVRLRTGAYRWRLYRNVGDPHRMTEVFLLRSWEQHLRQHDRLDADAVRVIEQARAYDIDGAPVTRHLAAVDVREADERPDWDALVAVHTDLHDTDGSFPLKPARRGAAGA